MGIYESMASYLRDRGYGLTVISEGLPEDYQGEVLFDHRTIRLTFGNIVRAICAVDPAAVVYWVRLRHLYLFPLLFFLKLRRIKAIYWGHGSDLLSNKGIRFRRFANKLEYIVSDALILYSSSQLKHVDSQFHRKTFIANNTLSFSRHSGRFMDRASCLAKYGIQTKQNIICVGRMQRRKRLEHLVEAYQKLKTQNVGLILVGPDTDGILNNIEGQHIYKLGPVYGDATLDLLAASDVFCLPGAVGLSIVDAFYCGLPLITEEGDESPEMMYLKDGVNGFIIRRGNIEELARKIDLLLGDVVLRRSFSEAARQEIRTSGHINKMSEGFASALDFVIAH